MKGFDTFKNALTFETKRLCVSTKTQGRFRNKKTASQSLTKGLYNAAFLIEILPLLIIRRSFFKKRLILNFNLFRTYVLIT